MTSRPKFSNPRPTERIEVLEKNFFDSLRDGKTPVANLELAIRAQTVLSMAEMSERLGLALFFDEKTRTLKSGDGRTIPALSYGTRRAEAWLKWESHSHTAERRIHSAFGSRPSLTPRSCAGRGVLGRFKPNEFGAMPPESLSPCATHSS